MQNGCHQLGRKSWKDKWDTFFINTASPVLFMAQKTNMQKKLLLVTDLMSNSEELDFEC